jgi:hypothetical protein
LPGCGEEGHEAVELLVPEQFAELVLGGEFAGDALGRGVAAGRCGVQGDGASGSDPTFDEALRARPRRRPAGD